MNRIEKWIHNKLNNKAEKENYPWVSIKTDDEKRMSNKLISQYDWEKIQDKIKTQKNEIFRLNSIINELEWKPIEEYDKGNYDWVLVKCFDGDYECVPCVAEKRFGKWHSIDEKEIKFDVKYFMDMQQIDELQELKGE